MGRTPDHITLSEAARRLDVHYMTAYRYVRTGRLDAVKRGGEWQVKVADVDHLIQTGAAPSAPSRTRGTRRHEYPRRLLDRLINSDEAGAWSIIEGAMTAGMTPSEIYLEMFVPVLKAVGDQWKSGEITVAQEHQASAIVLRLIGRLGPRFARRGRRRGVVIVGAPPGDGHGIPTALMGDLLRGRGYTVIDLGADVPSASWAETAIRTRGLTAIGVCATSLGNDNSVRSTIEALREVTRAPIILGGNSVTSEQHSEALGATAFSKSFAHAIDLIDELGSQTKSTKTPKAPATAAALKAAPAQSAPKAAKAPPPKPAPAGVTRRSAHRSR